MKAFIDFPKADLPKGDVVATLRWKGDGYVGEIVKAEAKAPAEEWISTKKAAQILGFDGKLAARTVLRLADDGFLISKRPSPKKVKILLASVLEHLEKTKDPDFWFGKKLRQQRELPEPKPTPGQGVRIWEGRIAEALQEAFQGREILRTPDVTGLADKFSGLEVSSFTFNVLRKQTGQPPQVLR